MKTTYVPGFIGFLYLIIKQNVYLRGFMAMCYVVAFCHLERNAKIFLVYKMNDFIQKEEAQKIVALHYVDTKCV